MMINTSEIHVGEGRGIFDMYACLHTQLTQLFEQNFEKGL